jgi:hypothetical protein
VAVTPPPREPDVHEPTPGMLSREGCAPERACSDVFVTPLKTTAASMALACCSSRTATATPTASYRAVGVRHAASRPLSRSLPSRSIRCALPATRRQHVKCYLLASAISGSTTVTRSSGLGSESTATSDSGELYVVRVGDAVVLFRGGQHYPYLHRPTPPTPAILTPPSDTAASLRLARLIRICSDMPAGGGAG